jgi:hypothetical protein
MARLLNKKWEREGHLWGSRYRSEPCVDDGAAEEKLFYVATNPTKDNLCERASLYTGFSTYNALAYGDELKYWYIDWLRWHNAGGRCCKKPITDFVVIMPLKVTPLPQWEEMTAYQQQTRFRKQIKEREKEHEKKRAAENMSVIGVNDLYQLEPRQRPKNPKSSGAQPLCHASSKEAEEAYLERLREFRCRYIAASADFRNRKPHKESLFPDGSYPPPIQSIYFASEL